ncbi:MAG: 2-oxoacid:acceptor oxidoreductase family protein [Deltaproteobacteria bacterium]|nr:2-oxoacid:acceptor oxidoreductase family protein [Deltaproteobacteria bacterium]
MMRIRILCAGFGGQGALLIGKLVAEAAMAEGNHVTWLPSYGPEMRGGTANVMVIVSDKPIGSPIFTRIDALVALNQPSLEKFAPQCISGSNILSNSSLCTEIPVPEGVTLVNAPFTRIAEEVGDTKVSNMVGLGALIEMTRCVERKTVEEHLHQMLEKKNPWLLELNLSAISRGADYMAAIKKGAALRA